MLMKNHNWIRKETKKKMTKMLFIWLIGLITLMLDVSSQEALLLKQFQTESVKWKTVKNKLMQFAKYPWKPAFSSLAMFLSKVVENVFVRITLKFITTVFANPFFGTANTVKKSVAKLETFEPTVELDITMNFGRKLFFNLSFWCQWCLPLQF